MTYYDTGTDEQRVRVGVVGVDSGHLMVMDPCYVDSEWRPAAGAEVIAVEFWGRDERAVVRRLRQDPAVYRVFREAGKYRATPARGTTFGDLAQAVERARRPGEVVVIAQHTTSSYDEVCDLTAGFRFDSDDSGQLNYKLGHAGLGAVFHTGFGDGVYEVWATTRDYGDMGRRIAKVEIVMIEEPCPDCGDEGWRIVRTDDGPEIRRCNACEIMTAMEARTEPSARRALADDRRQTIHGRLMAMRVAAAMGART